MEATYNPELEIQREQQALYAKRFNLSDETLEQYRDLCGDQERLEEAFSAIVASIVEESEQNRLNFYTPGKKHAEFFEAGKEFPFRMFTAMNRGGKSTAGGAEDAYHLTGLYPDWWKGRRFYKPVEWLVMGNTVRQLRKSVQTILFGPVGKWGTGMIPAELLLNVKTVHGVSGAIDFAEIQHVPTGGVSNVYLGSAEAGWQAYQGGKYDGIHQDEEPAKNDGMELFVELAMRLIDSDGIFYITATPQQGMTELCSLWWGTESEDDESQAATIRREAGEYFHLTQMTIDDCDHLTEKQKRLMKAIVPPHQRAARLFGIPVLEGGMVWPYQKAKLLTDYFDVLKFPDLLFACGMDHGHQNSYTAMVWLVMDSEKRIIAIDCEKIRGEGLKANSLEIRKRDQLYGFAERGIPVAWPKDMNAENIYLRVPVHDYRNEGINMMEIPAGFSDERKYDNESQFQFVRNLMYDDKFKIMNTPRMQRWWREHRIFSYDEKTGKPAKTRAMQFDLMDATRYGVVMLHEGHGRRTSRYRPRMSRMSLGMAIPAGMN